MVRSKCGIKLVDKKSTNNLMQMLVLNETIVQLGNANSSLCCRHLLRKVENKFLRWALDFKVKWTRKRGIGKPG